MKPRGTKRFGNSSVSIDSGWPSLQFLTSSRAHAHEIGVEGHASCEILVRVFTDRRSASSILPPVVFQKFRPQLNTVSFSRQKRFNQSGLAIAVMACGVRIPNQAAIGS